MLHRDMEDFHEKRYLTIIMRGIRMQIRMGNGGRCLLSEDIIRSFLALIGLVESWKCSMSEKHLAIEDGKLERRAFDGSGFAGDGNLESTSSSGVVENFIFSCLVVLDNGLNLYDISVRLLEN